MVVKRKSEVTYFSEQKGVEDGCLTQQVENINMI